MLPRALLGSAEARNESFLKTMITFVFIQRIKRRKEGEKIIEARERQPN